MVCAHVMKIIIFRRRTTNASKAPELSTEDDNVELESSDARWNEAKDMLAFNKDISHIETVTKQLPQGTIITPLLFAIYFSDNIHYWNTVYDLYFIHL